MVMTQLACLLMWQSCLNWSSTVCVIFTLSFPGLSNLFQKGHADLLLLIAFVRACLERVMLLQKGHADLLLLIAFVRARLERMMLLQGQ